MNYPVFKIFTIYMFMSGILFLSNINFIYADALDEIHGVNKPRTLEAKTSQQQVEKLDDERHFLLNEYKTVNKVIDGLRVYNKQLEKQIIVQQQQLDDLEQSIAQATEMKRQITPLMIRMTDSLDQFVNLDLPFHLQERQQRLSFIKNALSNPSISDSEKFRQVLEGYQIESEYGKKIDAYTDTIKINGINVNVNILRVGRIALVAQTKDEKITLVWSKKQQEWIRLPTSYRNPVRQGIRIARKQATINMMMLPIDAPENAQ